MKIKSTVYILICVLSTQLSVFSQSLNQAYLSYISQYSKIAQKQQRDYGIPASITLAQGLLESGAGQSVLSKSSNNHFGIKCADWKGDKVYSDDDLKDECFRKYNSAQDSYEDHSLFLKLRPRYASLFQLQPADYEGWAFGLKKAGYATDPTYAYKLISIVENYSLHKFDLEQSYSKVSNDQTDKVIPKSANKIAVETSSNSIGTIKASLSHEVKRVNGSLFVTSAIADTYATIADEFNISEKRLRRYNDVNDNVDLLPAKRVFITTKKKKASKECLVHKVIAGESMLSISQDYAVKVEELYILNNMLYTEGVKFGQVLKLR